MITKKSPDGFDYYVDASGTIHQAEPQPIQYDEKYIADRYLPAVIPAETLTGLGLLRWGYFLGQFIQYTGHTALAPARVLDWGFGAGAFLRAAAASPSTTACGYDISGWAIPAEAKFIPHPLNHSWDLVTFFDVLEHIEDLSFLRDLDTRWLVISVPWCPLDQSELVPSDAFWERFWVWKHRRPNEHLHHWNAGALRRTLFDFGFHMTQYSAIEDIIRKGPVDRPNILTMTFRRN